MSSFTRRSAAGVFAVAAVAGTTTLVAASPASAASYHCKTSKESIDTANYSGPWADQWDVTTKLCTKKSGGYVYAYAKISWDGPVFAEIDDSGIWDDAYFRLQIKKSQSGTDPVKVTKYANGIEGQLENSTGAGNYNGSYTTGVAKWKAGSARAVADGSLMLDWRRCCGGYKTHDFAASPVV